MVFFTLGYVLRGFPAAAYLNVRLAENPCAASHPWKKILIYELGTYMYLPIPLIYVCCVCSRGVLFRITILAEWLRHFNGLAEGDRCARMVFARERGGGRNAPAAKSLK
jgi:hypothetical protein